MGSNRVKDNLERVSDDFKMALFWRGEGLNSNVPKFLSVKITNLSNVPGFTILYVCRINSVWVIVEFSQRLTEIIDLPKLFVGRIR